MSTETDALGAERDAARVEVSQLHAKIERVEQLAAEAEARGAKSLPPGMVVSGCSPLASVVTPEQIRDALAAPLGETPGGD